jgi:nicotinate phosphoribosyltransferase
VTDFATLILTPSEASWLETACPYLTPTYLAYLSAYRYKPEQVKVTYVPVTPDNLFGHVEIEVVGPWVETILWEVPLMATLSETFFQSVVTDWNYDNQYELAFSKAQSLSSAGCRFSEFGTRRRRSYQTQDTVLRALVDATRGTQALSGTSNVHFAQKYDLIPIGTIAHEWFMGVAALKGYEHANSTALRLWENVYTGAGAPLISLTDTFSTDAFMKDFVADPELAYRWAGLRQDSGNPFDFGPRVKAMYESLGIPYESKAVIFSDSLSVDKCIALQKQCDELGFKKVSYGIGTFFTNDFKAASTGEKSKALNIVIKLASVDGKPCVKISDDLTKNTGDKDTVKFVKDMHCLV